MTAKQILKELKSLGTEATKKTLLRHGAKEPVFGVKVADLKVFQKKIKKDYQLALDLYDSGNFDAMYLAGLVADETKMTKKDLKKWVKGAYGGWLPAFIVPWVASESDHGWDLALEWIEAKPEMVCGAGWWTLGSLCAIKADDDLDLKAFKQLLKRVAKELPKEKRNSVRLAMNQLVIAVGSGIRSLTAEAIKIGEKVGPIEADRGDTACETPYSPDYIRKIESKGRIGKKRKTARC
ncbi:MAG: DNA alkylation repair protein [Limisphaerales bacterium]